MNIILNTKNRRIFTTNIPDSESPILTTNLSDSESPPVTTNSSDSDSPMLLRLDSKSPIYTPPIDPIAVLNSNSTDLLLIKNLHEEHKEHEEMNKKNRGIEKRKTRKTLDLLSFDFLKRILLMVSSISEAKGKILFIASDNKYYNLLKKINVLTAQPFFIGKWIGGYLTNFDKINTEKNMNKGSKTSEILLKNSQKISCVIVLDPQNSLIAIQEATILNLPIICFFEYTKGVKKNNYPSYTPYFFPIVLKKRNPTLVNEYDSFRYIYPVLNLIVKAIGYDRPSTKKN